MLPGPLTRGIVEAAERQRERSLSGQRKNKGVPQSLQKPRPTAWEALNTPGAPDPCELGQLHTSQRCKVTAEHLLVHPTVADVRIGRLGEEDVADHSAFNILRYGGACAIQAWKLLSVARFGASRLARGMGNLPARLRTVQPSQTNVSAARVKPRKHWVPKAVGLSRKGQETSVSGHGLDGDTTWTSETSMLMHRILAVLLWVLAAIAAFAISAVWIIDAQSGMVSAWVILPFFWSAAVLSILGHYLAQWRPPIARYLARHRPLAGPRAGAELPG